MPSTHETLNAGIMLGERRRRWPNNQPTLGQCIVFATFDHNDSHLKAAFQAMYSVHEIPNVSCFILFQRKLAAAYLEMK